VRKWNQTTIVWHAFAWRLLTDISSSAQNIPDDRLVAKFLQARSLPDGSIEMELHVKKQIYVIAPADQSAVEDRVRRLPGYLDRMAIRGWGLDSWKGEMKFVASPQPRTGFCEGAFALVADLLVVLGMEDKGKVILGDFTIVQKTFVRSRRHWVPYEDWLRQKFSLPSALPQR